MKLKLRFRRGHKVVRGPKEMLVLSESTPFAVTEAYKATRTNLMFMLADKENKIVAFTSPNISEGKTITCINTSITFAQTGSKTLIIDADMRKPRVHSGLSVQSSPGLSDRLGGFSEEVCIYETAHDNLYVMPAGTLPPNPAELLASKRMKALLETLSEEFDYIFIDCPPIEPVTDAAILSSLISGIVVVARHSIATRESINYTLTALEQAGANILGFILNGVPLDRRPYNYRYKDYNRGYSYSYGYYGYGYGYGYDNEYGDRDRNRDRETSQ